MWNQNLRKWVSQGIKQNWVVAVLPLDHMFCKCLGSESWKKKRALRVVCTFMRFPKCWERAHECTVGLQKAGICLPGVNHRGPTPSSEDQMGKGSPVGLASGLCSWWNLVEESCSWDCNEASHSPLQGYAKASPLAGFQGDTWAVSCQKNHHPHPSSPRIGGPKRGTLPA